MLNSIEGDQMPYSGNHVALVGADKPGLSVKASHPKLAVAGMNAGKNGQVGIVAADKPELEVKTSNPKLGLAGQAGNGTN